MLLSDLTTLGVGGAAERIIRCETEEELIATVRALDDSGARVLLLGGGSNIVMGDDLYRGTVVCLATQGVTEAIDGSKVTIDVAAGEPWDALVAGTVARGWSGIEALSGIPGLTGATAIQNVGAYGQEVSQTISRVRAFDRQMDTVVEFDHGGCEFGYRTSVFKAAPGRWVILSTTFALTTDGACEVRYAQLAKDLGVQIGESATPTAVRAAVLRLRAAKGMLLDPTDADTRSAGSFFTNPIVSADQADLLPDECPRYSSDLGVKLSAAWLIEQAGITKGWQLDQHSRARVSTKHTLAITTEAGAQASEVISLAQVIRQRVKDRFGIELEPEPTLVNCELPPTNPISPAI